MEENIDDKKVQVIYCRCGKSVDRVIGIEIERTPAEKAKITREVNQAKSFGIKTEIITLGEYKKLPFMCNGVIDCLDNQMNNPD